MVEKYYGSKEWADESLRYFLGILSDNSTWNLPHNWFMKRLVSHIILERLRDQGFEWHHKVGSGHFHRWLKRKSWEPISRSRIGANIQLKEVVV